MEEVLQRGRRVELDIRLIIEEILRHIQVLDQFTQYQQILVVQDVMQHLLIIMVLHLHFLHTLQVENI